MNLVIVSRLLAGFAVTSLFASQIAAAAKTAALPRGAAPRGGRTIGQDRVAVIVGVNRYFNLDGATLNGAVPDAQAMARRLEMQGYRVILLTDAEATKANILRRIREIGGADHVFFYFSGHGSPGRGDRPYILPSDTQAGVAETGLNVDELYDAVGGVPARARTVMLDSCFSGLMMRRALASGSGVTLNAPRPRVYDFLGGGGIGGRSATRQTPIQPLGHSSAAPRPGASICYVTASGGDEYSWEYNRRGVFTAAIEPHLNGDGATWGAILETVRDDVASALRRISQQIGQTYSQTPQVSGGFLQAPHLGGPGSGVGSGGPGPATSLSSLLDVYRMNSPDARALTLSSTAASSLIDLGERVRLTIRAEKSGYLIVLNQTPDDRVSVLFPAPGRLGDGQVRRGRTITVPANSDGWLVADQAGNDCVKALLFERREDAERILDLFESGDRFRQVPTRTRFLQEIPITQGGVVTAELRFQVRR